MSGEELLDRQPVHGARPPISLAPRPPWGEADMSAAAGRRAVVTGAASGIGLAVAQRLRREGASVLAADVNAAGLAAAAKAGCETMAVNLAEPAERDRLAKAADGVDYLVNAAGIIRIKPIFEVTVEDWR